MAKTYQLKALWPLLQFETAAAPLLATLDAYGGGLVKYAVSQDGFWLFSQSQPFSARESEGLTGFHPADLAPKRIDGVAGYFYGMQDGAPLLPLPFTAAQLIEFDRRTAGLVVASIERGNDTEGWIAELGKNNPDAAELASGIHGGKWPVDLANLADTKTDNVSKPRFHLAGGIVPSASAKAAKSVLDEAQRQQDAIRLMGISPDLLKEIDRQKDMEKLIGGGVSSLANATYLQDIKQNQDLLCAMHPSASEIAAEALGRQLSSFDPGANTYLQSQSVLQKEIEKAAGVGIGTVGEISRRRSPVAFAPYALPTARPCGYRGAVAPFRRCAQWSGRSPAASPHLCAPAHPPGPRRCAALAIARRLPVRPPWGLPQSGAEARRLSAAD